MRNNPRLCTVLYLVSCILDAFDGKMARLLNQSTRLVRFWIWSPIGAFYRRPD